MPWAIIEFNEKERMVEITYELPDRKIIKEYYGEGYYRALDLYKKFKDFLVVHEQDNKAFVELDDMSLSIVRSFERGLDKIFKI